MTQFKARPTVYKGIQMRSRLEAGYAAWLDQWHFDWEYEPCAFAGSRGQYLPDFRIPAITCTWLNEPAVAYIEVKPKDWPYWNNSDDSSADHQQLMRRMAIIWESEPDAILLLAQPGDSTLLTNHDFRGCTVGALDIGWSPDDVDPYPWPTLAFWVKLAGEQLGLGRVLPAVDGPWPDGYWKVT